MTRKLWIVFSALLFVSGPALGAQDQAIERRIDALLGKMTLEEKLGQLQQLGGKGYEAQPPELFELARKGLLGSTLNVLGAVNTNALQKAALESRLKIPILFAYDTIHGYRTVFPVPLAEAGTWEPETAERAAAIAAAETAASGVKWTFAPMMDIARDPRWGRIVEGSGEDTYLGAAMARARVRGFQGKDMSAPDKVAACAKHWVAYGAAEAGRDYNWTDVSERILREIYFPPFKAAVDAGVATFMSSFNDVSGLPASANPWTLTGVLRKEWGFDGFVVSDYSAIHELIKHGLAADGAEAARLALPAGEDMEMVSTDYNQHVPELVKAGKVQMSTVDEAVRRILRIKFRLGLFDRPFTDEAAEKAALMKPEYLAAAREAAAKSLILLKNDGATLPLRKDLAKLAVIGPLADDPAPLGSWSGQGEKKDVVTLLAGLKAKLGSKTEIVHAKGCDILCASDAGFSEAASAAKAADAVVLAIGEGADMTGEASSRSDIGLPGRQQELADAVFAAAGKKPVAVVLMNGRPLVLGRLADGAPAILETWFAGLQAGPAIADALFGDVNPGGKLPATFPLVLGQVPIYYNHRNGGRPDDPADHYTSKYLDVPNFPQYPFGWGLSYTTFKLADLELDRPSVTPKGRLNVQVSVQNTGAVGGDEVVQLYLHSAASNVTRPVRELKGFSRVHLGPGQKRVVKFTLGPDEIGSLGRDMKWRVEPGKYEVFAATDSTGGLKASFQVLSVEDDGFLDDLEKRSFQFFVEQQDPKTGLIMDRAGADGAPSKLNNAASIASVGFGLSALCVGAERGWMPREEAQHRARLALDFIVNQSSHVAGWYYHFVDPKTGRRAWGEVSTIDTGLLLAGALTARQCFKDDPEIVRLASALYERIDYPAMLNGSPNLLSMGYTPEKGFIEARWDRYCEHPVLTLLGMASPTKPLPASSWAAWRRDWKDYGGYHYMDIKDTSLFMHQYPYAWFDMRSWTEKGEAGAGPVNYFENSEKATRAHQRFCVDELAKEFPASYGGGLWGVTASDGKKGYNAWGGPPKNPAIDGTVVPCASGGSLMFTPDISLDALKTMFIKFGNKAYKRYGFVDAFNPTTGWFGPDVIGIDVGITLLSAENLRTGSVWRWFMANPEAEKALRLAGFSRE